MSSESYCNHDAPYLKPGDRCECGQLVPAPAVTVYIVSVEGNDYARAEVEVFATEAGADKYLRELQEILLANDRARGLEDVPASLADADAVDWFGSRGSDSVYFSLEPCAVKP